MVITCRHPGRIILTLTLVLWHCAAYIPVPLHFITTLTRIIRSATIPLHAHHGCRHPGWTLVSMGNMVHPMRVHFGVLRIGVSYLQRNIRPMVTPLTVSSGLTRTWKAGWMNRGKRRSGTLRLKNLKHRYRRNLTSSHRHHNGPSPRNRMYQWYKTLISLCLIILSSAVIKVMAQVTAKVTVTKMNIIAGILMLPATAHH